jgi:V/A-type H+/Na+-transporting ATPase subunit E
VVLSGIEYTVKKVSDEALSEMLQIIEESKAAAMVIVTRKSSEAEAESLRIDEARRRQADALKRQIIGSAEMTARNRTLEIVEENLNSAFSQALDKLGEMTSQVEYNRILKSLVLEGIDEVGGNQFVVSASSKDQQLLQLIVEQVSHEKDVSIVRSDTRTKNSVGGVVISSADGFVTFDNTFEARLERLKPELRKQIAQLFTGQS